MHDDAVVAAAPRLLRVVGLFAPVAVILAFLALPQPIRPLILIAAVAGYLLAAALGLFFASRIAADTPCGERWPLAVPLTARIIIGSVVSGVLIGTFALIAVFSAARNHPHVLARLRPRMEMAVWRRLVLALHAGITEETLFRLVLLSGAIWIALMISRRLRVRTSANAIFWFCNIAIAVAFGAAHLSAWAAVTNVTVLLAAGVIVVNAVGSLALGVVYWRWGIVAAMIAHVCADATLWGLGPSLL